MLCSYVFLFSKSRLGVIRDARRRKVSNKGGGAFLNFFVCNYFVYDFRQLDEKVFRGRAAAFDARDSGQQNGQ